MTSETMEKKLKEVKQAINCFKDYISEFGDLGDAHMVDYFVKDHWNQLLNEEIKDDLMNLPVTNLRKISGLLWNANNHDENGLSLPFSHSYSGLNYHIRFVNKCQCLFSNLITNASHAFDDLKTLSDCSNANPEMKIESNECMSAKKSHEVSVMSPVIYRLCRVCQTEFVLDIGSGKGYLSAYLTFRYNLSVTGIERNEDNCVSAISRAKKYLNYWLKHPYNAEVRGNKVLLQEKEMKFKSVVTQVAHNTKLLPDKMKCIAVGLHACGDLSCHIISLFCEEEHIVGLCVVGCCYHQNTELHEMEENETPGFPMSAYLKEKKMRLGRRKRMLALQAPERNANHDPSVEYTDSERSLFYRAVLNVLMKEVLGVDVERSDHRVGKVFAKSKDFVDYVRKCLKKLKVDDDALKDETILEYLEQYEGRFKEMIAFTLLRQMYAPAIELLILLDRYCYLLENASTKGIANCFIAELFDAVLSPRRFALIAVKDC